MKAILLPIACSLFTSCGGVGNKCDKLILTDEKTGKKYILIHNRFDTYFIFEQVTQISGKDTTIIFK